MVDVGALRAALSSPAAGECVAALDTIRDLGEVAAVEFGLDDDVVPKLMDPRTEVREAAVLALGATGAGGGRHLEMITQRLGLEDRRVRRAAVQALGWCGGQEERCASTLEALLDDADVDFVVDACQSLANLRAMSSTGKLVTKLSGEAEVAVAATRALAVMEAEPDAIAALLGRKEAPVLAAAIEALAATRQGLGHSAAIAPFVGHGDCEVRLAATEYISTVGAGAAAEVSVLASFLSDANPGAVAAAAASLAGIGPNAASSEVVAQLEALLDNESEDRSPLVPSAAGVRAKPRASLRKPACAAAAALAAVGPLGAAAAPKVALALDSKDPDLRAEAATALGLMGKEGARFEEQVLALLNDPTPTVVASACVAVGRMAAAVAASEPSAAAVAGCLLSSYPPVRAAACEAISMMGEEGGPYLETIVGLCNDKAQPVQVQALKALPRFGEAGEVFATQVCHQLFEGGVAVRVAACEALALMGERGAAFAEEIESCLYDVPEVSTAAEQALASFSRMAEQAALQDDAGGAELPLPPRPYVDAARASLPVGLIFPGQGSQNVGMLNEVKDIPHVKEMLDRAKVILGYDILQICLRGPESRLEQTKYCQPAMYISGLAAVEKLRLENPQYIERCKAVAGLSLGEYTALTVAGVLSFETGLKLVKLRGEAMQEAADMSPQKMCSVAGLDQEKLDSLCKEAAAGGNTCQVANFLFPAGFSCSGSASAVEALVDKAMAAGALQAKVLKTSGAFHTDLMRPAREKLLSALRATASEMKPPVCEVYMNITGQKLLPGTDPRDIFPMLADQLCNCVQWEPSVKRMIEDGITQFYECGPNKQLKAMMKRIDTDAWKNTENIPV